MNCLWLKWVDTSFSNWYDKKTVFTDIFRFFASRHWYQYCDVITESLLQVHKKQDQKLFIRAIFRGISRPLQHSSVWLLHFLISNGLSHTVATTFLHFYTSTRDCIQQLLQLVYLNGNNAAEGENNIENAIANSYPMNWTVKNWFAQDIFESLWQEINWNCYWVGCFVGLNRYCVQGPFSSSEFELNGTFYKQQFEPWNKERQILHKWWNRELTLKCKSKC